MKHFNMERIIKSAQEEAQKLGKKIGKNVKVRLESPRIDFIYTIEPMNHKSHEKEPFLDTAKHWAKKNKFKIDKDDNIIVKVGGVNWIKIKGDLNRRIDKWIEDVMANSPNY